MRTGRARRRGDVVDAGPPLVLLVHAVEPDEVLLRVAGHLRGSRLNGASFIASIPS